VPGARQWPELPCANHYDYDDYDHHDNDNPVELRLLFSLQFGVQLLHLRGFVWYVRSAAPRLRGSLRRRR
jgi:hypothetical protein